MNKLDVSNFLVHEVPIVYHATSECNAQKILENGFDGIKNKELVLLFGNKTIEKMEIVPRNDEEFDFEILSNI